MNSLLTALATRQIFVVYGLFERAGGGLDKIPIDPTSLRPSNAQDSATWMLPAEAQAYADLLGPGYGVGLVIQPPFFCIDIDHCLQSDGQWSPLAHKLCRQFAGAAIEVSVSGKALHVFGTYQGSLGSHRTRNAALHLELYTGARFIALTGTQLVGDVLSDHTDALRLVLAEYFPAKPESDSSVAWTEGPAEGWSGPADDDELITLAMGLRGSAASIFGSRATFADLWMGNAEALGKAFPSQSQGKAWDYSAADQALSNHLAYLTGSDCERMARLMLRSALKRDKWEREAYFRGTIVKAAGECKRWLSQRPPTHSPPPAAGTPEPTAEPSVPQVGGILTGAEQQALFRGCIYVRDIHAALLPDGATISSERFNVQFGGRQFIITADGSRPTREAWEAFTKSEIESFPKVHGMVFDPRLPPRALIEKEGGTFINSWVPISIAKTPGDPTPFLRHLGKTYPDPRDQAVLLAYFATIVQYPGEKFQWAPLLQGVEGNGKSFFSFALEQCVGERYTHHAKASQLDSRFNSALYGKLLICVEDVFISEAKNSMWETLKPMITNRRLEIEGKGIDKVTRDTCFNFIMNSNHKDAIRKTANERRVAPFFGAQQRVEDLTRDSMGEDYFRELYGWARERGGWAVIAHYLSNYQIPDELNPAKGAIRAPRTSSTQDAIVSSRGSAEQEVAEAIEEGRQGFRGGWVSSIAVDHLLEQCGKARLIPQQKRRELLQDMGFRPHPGLPDGRVMQPLADGSRPRLYVVPGHPTWGWAVPAAVTAAYVEAQL